MPKDSTPSAARMARSSKAGAGIYVCPLYWTHNLNTIGRAIYFIEAGVLCWDGTCLNDCGPKSLTLVAGDQDRFSAPSALMARLV